MTNFQNMVIETDPGAGLESKLNYPDYNPYTDNEF